MSTFELNVVFVWSVGIMGSNAIPVDAMDSSDDEFQDLEGMNVGIPECEGLPRRL